MGVFLKQLLAGRDFARADHFAGQMANFVYLVGDEETRECMVIDPAWDIEGILNEVDELGLKLAGVLVSHYHPDHVGGNIFGHRIAGLEELQVLRPVIVYVNKHEADGIKLVSGISEGDLQRLEGGDEISVGNTVITFLHTPGHTPGSQCFLVGSSLISGDTLFIGGCGRVDLPGGNADQMYYSLTQVLGKLPDSTKLYPGHHYASLPVSTIGHERLENRYMRIPTLDEWRSLMKE